MWAVFWRILKDRRIILLVYTLASIGLLWMYIGLFPTFKDQSANLEQLIKSYPESLLKAFNFDIKSFTTLEGFLSTEQYSFVWPLMVVFIAIGFAGSCLAGEIERGTIEVLLAQPISRLKLFISRYLAGIFMLIVFIFFSVYAAPPLSHAYEIDFKAENFTTLAILCFMFSLSIYSIGMFLSSIFSDRGKVFFISGGLIVAMYVINIVSTLKDNLEDLKYFSFFYYFNPSQALVYNKIDEIAYWVFFGTAIIMAISGLIIFSKRNIVA